MYEKLHSIKIKSDFFENETFLPVLPSEKPVSIIYGKNGSGKTTLAEAFKLFADGEEEILFDLIDVDGNSISHEIDKSAIHVFNESFIHSKVQFSEGDGLESIVMLGDIGDIEEEIRNCDADLLRINEELESIQEQETKFLDRNDTESHLYYAAKIDTELRSGWATREQRIKGLSQRATVNDGLKNNVYTYLDTERNKQALEHELNTALDLLKESDSSVPVDISRIRKLPLNDSQNQTIIGLLEKAIPEPVLTKIAL